MAKDFRKQIGGKKNNNSVISGLIRGSAQKNEKYTLVQLPHEKVYSRAQARKKFKNIEELAATMKDGKQAQPITVFDADADGRHLIKVGERRWRACVLNDEPVWAQIIHGMPKPETQDAKTLVDQIIENDQREPLTPMEMATNLAELRDLFGMKTGEIAESMGRKPAFVSKHLKLLEMPEPVQQLLEDEVVTYIETLNALTSIFKLSEEVGIELIEEARNKGELSRDEAQARLKILKAHKLSPSDNADNQPHSNNDNSPLTGINTDSANLQMADSVTQPVDSDKLLPDDAEPQTSGDSSLQTDNADHNNLQTPGNIVPPVDSDKSLPEDDQSQTSGDSSLQTDNADHNNLQTPGNIVPPVDSDKLLPDDAQPQTSGDSSLQTDNAGHNNLQTPGNIVPPVDSDKSLSEDDQQQNSSDNSVQSDTAGHNNLPTPSNAVTPANTDDDNQSLSSKTAHADSTVKNNVTFYIRIDDSVFELVDKPSITENGEVYIFCREKEGMPEMQVPITDCMLDHASLTK